MNQLEEHAIIPAPERQTQDKGLPASIDYHSKFETSQDYMSQNKHTIKNIVNIQLKVMLIVSLSSPISPKDSPNRRSKISSQSWVLPSKSLVEHLTSHPRLLRLTSQYFPVPACLHCWVERPSCVWFLLFRFLNS